MMTERQLIIKIVETFVVSLDWFKGHQHKQREELERKTRLNSVDFYNFDRKGVL